MNLDSIIIRLNAQRPECWSRPYQSLTMWEKGAVDMWTQLVSSFATLAGDTVEARESFVRVCKSPRE